MGPRHDLPSLPLAASEYHAADLGQIARAHAQAGERERAAPGIIGPSVEKTTYEDLEQMLLDHYRTNRLRSLARIEGALQHLRGFFARALALEITTDRTIVPFRQPC
jgi:hypothetical protein